MDCSICFDAITKETGVTTLSCQHSFHFRCINQWFWKQFMNDLPDNCPCCRSNGGDKDRCFFEDLDREEEEKEEENEFMNRLQEILIPYSRGLERIANQREERAFDGLRDMFGPLNELEEEDTWQTFYQEIATRYPRVDSMIRHSIENLIEIEDEYFNDELVRMVVKQTSNQDAYAKYKEHFETIRQEKAYDSFREMFSPLNELHQEETPQMKARSEIQQLVGRACNMENTPGNARVLMRLFVDAYGITL